jgi:Flp pilus assembly protein TadG
MAPPKAKKARDDIAGLSAVEAAIFVPVLFLLIFGALEYSWAFLKVQQMNGAARQAARLGIIEGATAAQLRAEIDRLMADAGMAGAGYSVTMVPPDPATLTSGQPFQVRISVPYANVELIGLPVLPTPATLRVNTTMAREAPR